MSEVLKKPVHLAILKESDIQRLAREGKLKDQPFAMSSPTQAKLPTETKPRLTYNVTKGPDMMKQMRTRVHLRLVHDSIPPIPPEKQPPCDTCKTAACCRAYVVHITQEEYESGLYGDAAIEITDEIRKQLSPESQHFVHLALQMPNVYFVEDHKYFLEGMIGEPCKFLGSDNRCTIYDIRPITCRAYTCVDDPRITQEMRDGTVDIRTAMIDNLLSAGVQSED